MKPPEMLLDPGASLMLSFLVDNLDHVDRGELTEAAIEAACDALFPGSGADRIALEVPVELRPVALHLLADFAERADETAVEHQALLAAGDWAPCHPAACQRAANALRIARWVLEHRASADATRVRQVVTEVVRDRIACVAGWDGFSPGSIDRMIGDIADRVAAKLPMPILSADEHAVLDARTMLLTLLDAVDYERGACRINELVGAVLPQVVLRRARAAAEGKPT